MVHIKTQSEIEKMRASGLIIKELLKEIEKLIKPGVKAIELDTYAENFIRNKGAVPNFKNYGGFLNTMCVSINDEVVHGAPGNRVLKEGDIISVDLGANLNGFHSDAARTFAVGKISPEKQQLINVTKQCFFEAIKPLKGGVKLNIVGEKIQNYAEKFGYGVVRDLCGHGIGTSLHEEPSVLNYKNNLAFVLEEGMTICIEPMINMGNYKVLFDKKSMIVRTKDKLPSAHYENTILICKDGVEILTE